MFASKFEARMGYVKPDSKQTSKQDRERGRRRKGRKSGGRKEGREEERNLHAQITIIAVKRQSTEGNKI